MGPALYRLCKFDDSVQAFNESLTNDPSNVEIITNKASALRKLGYHNEAIQLYDKVIQIDPNFVPAINNKANIYASLGNYEKAVFLYAEALGKNPNYGTARQNLEIALANMPQDIETQKEQPKQNTQPNLLTSEIATISQPKTLQNEKSPDIFEQIGSMFSSIRSILGFSN